MILAFDELPLHSRVWIFQASRLITGDEISEISRKTENFLNEWTAHKVDLKAACKIIDHLFLVISVDETSVNASGCSLDKLHRFVKDLQESLKLDFFNRLKVAYVDRNQQIAISPVSEIESALRAGEMNGDVLVYDITVTSVGDLQTGFCTSLKKSWLNRYLN